MNLIEAPAPYCYLCKRSHEMIPWKPDTFVWRCNGCHSYGGPTMVEDKQTPPPPAAPVADPEPAAIVVITQDDIGIYPGPVVAGPEDPGEVIAELEETPPDRAPAPDRKTRSLKSRRPVQNPRKRSRKLKAEVGI